MKKIKVVYDSMDGTGFISRETAIYENIGKAVEDIVYIRNTMGYPTPEAEIGYMMEFWRWNKWNKLANFGFYNFKITIDYA